LDEAEDERKDDNQYKVEIKDVLSGLGSGPAGQILSVSQLIQMKLKQITSGNIDAIELDGSTQPSLEDLEVKSSKDIDESSVSLGEWFVSGFLYNTFYWKSEILYYILLYIMDYNYR
jgi:hypothetical protein